MRLHLFSRRTLLLIGVLILALVGTSGCSKALITALYALKGMDVDPDYPGLKAKTVLVVCRPPASLQYQDSRVAKEVARQVARLLKENGKKIKVVDQRKVDAWTDEHTWDDFPEVAPDLNPEMIVGIDLENFQLYQGQTLFQGKANASVKVYDCKKDNEVVFEKALSQIVYPPNICIHTSERQEAQFRREFILVVADNISRLFCAHDPHADIAQDTAAL